MRKLRLFDWLKIIQRFGGPPSPVPPHAAPTLVSDRASARASAVGPTHPQALERRVWEGRRPGLAGRRCPAVELCPAGCTVPAQARGRTPCRERKPGCSDRMHRALRSASAGIQRTPVCCSLLVGTHKHTHCMRCSPGKLFSLLWCQMLLPLQREGEIGL